MADKYENEADKFWNAFYSSNQNKFFKDRHWLFREFPQLNRNNQNGVKNKADDPNNAENETIKILEVGCGVGNTIFPIAEENKNVFLFGIDISSKAVDILKSQPNFDPKRMNCFVADLTQYQTNVSESDNNNNNAANKLRRNTKQNEVINIYDEAKFPIPKNSLDFVLMIFVLSAIPPQKFSSILSAVFQVQNLQLNNDQVLKSQLLIFKK